MSNVELWKKYLVTGLAFFPGGIVDLVAITFFDTFILASTISYFLVHLYLIFYKKHLFSIWLFLPGIFIGPFFILPGVLQFLVDKMEDIAS